MYEELIEAILTEVPLARVDDTVLYSEAIRRLNNISDSNIDITADTLTNRKKYRIPNYGTIIRQRLDVQKERPDLVDRRTAERRSQLEKEYRRRYQKGENGTAN